ncbi:general transcription factor 3c polypeptide 3 [Stylonychia lemnae]|uniref:General transcription factor 3c polypeptide 3 n=1 Tax=Stylonychia lemnae TaxID=5949 RepID=A0A078A4G6_STYLE|nr:general transcription factor 3c polypeptide 3 [Stylonychia lemnae]|eukprot:CDW76383.1 general transcription factor 3c polypeptide 3 [Stylonychia lemnae]
MLNVQYESDDDSSANLENPNIFISQALSSNGEEKHQSSDRIDLSSNIKPNIIKNESSSFGYASEDDQGENKKMNNNNSHATSKSEQSSNSIIQVEIEQQQPAELEEIVKMFAHDLQQSIRQRFKNKSYSHKITTNKKLPFEIQAKMGQANNLYAFNKFKEAIEILEEIITKMPDHAESYSTISSIYEEMGDYEKSLNFGVMAAFLLKTDVERWQKCANIAKFLRKLPIAIYCMNRAIKQTSQTTDIDEIIKMKFEKISIYKMQNDYSSAVRTLQKMIKKFITDYRRSYILNKALAQTFFEQGQQSKSFEVLDQMVELNKNDNNHLLEILLLYGDIARQTNQLEEFMKQMKRQTIKETLENLKKQSEYKIKVFQIQVRKFMCLIEEGSSSTQIDDFIKSISEFQRLNITDKLDQYQKVVSSILMLADCIENKANDVTSTIRIYESLLNFSLQIDQPNILYKLGTLYQKVIHSFNDYNVQFDDYNLAKEALEQAFIKCPIVQNGQIRIELSSVYNHLGMNKKALEILQNPFPTQQAEQTESILQKRTHKERKMDDEDIIFSDESENEGFDKGNDTLEQMIGKSKLPWRKFIVNGQMNLTGSENSSDCQTDSMMQTLNGMSSMQGTHSLFEPFKKPQFDDKEFLLKRNRRIQKRAIIKKDIEKETQSEMKQKMSKLKMDLMQFQASKYILILEQCKLHIKLNEIDQLSLTLNGEIQKILDNMILRQELQDLSYKQNVKGDTPQKEAFFIRKLTNSDSEREIGRIVHSAKFKFIEEIDQYPTVLTQIKPEELVDILFNYLKSLIQSEKYQLASEIIDLLNQVELLKQIISTNENLNKIFYEISTIAYFLSDQNKKAYKALRQISNQQDILNWAMMGSIISKNDDSSFCRSYFKRILQSKQIFNPFILMILGNNYLQKQQIELALRHYWLLNKAYHNKNSLLNLIIAITYLSQSYQRTNEDKEKSVKRALAFLMRYSETREDKIEVQYNVARALQFMGLNINAKEIYESIIALNKEQLNDNQKQIYTMAVFNLCQMIKGAGINSGITLLEGCQIERIKNNDLQRAHDLIMTNIII